jgi:regulator of protease activity HflC (stomatin/prohibitin superfamily)
MSLRTIVFLSSAALVAVIALAMWGFPRWNVWRARSQGEAEMARAEQNRRISVLEATAKRDSAKMYAEAEIERAKGVAEANKIIADGLKNNDEYLRYLWIDKVAAGASHEVIYIPTEASMPILESTRLRPAVQP